MAVESSDDVTQSTAAPGQRSRSSRAQDRSKSSAQSATLLPFLGLLRGVLRGFRGILATYIFSNLTRRIVVLNVAALAALVVGILYLNQFRAGLIDARVESLMTQGQIIAGAIAASATVETDAISVDPERLLRRDQGLGLFGREEEQSFALEFPINPERVGPVLRRLILPTQTRARIYDRDGDLLLDSRFFYARGQVVNLDPVVEEDDKDLLEQVIQRFEVWMQRRDLPMYVELGAANGTGYPEVVMALDGRSASLVRVDEEGSLVVSVAVPIQRLGAPVGVLLLSTEGRAINDIVRAERMGILRTFLVAAAITIVLSVLLAGTIAGPVKRLAASAEQVRRSVKARQEIPEFGERQDEIGHLARSFRDMTNALYDRIAAIEAFAADVSHELKNPLTSLRSAVETLPLARNESQRERLMDVIQHDVKRLDRLISDISDASRLDAELVRDDAEPVDLERLVESVVEWAGGLSGDQNLTVVADVRRRSAKDTFIVQGHDSRLGQVLTNLIDNARSFSPSDGTVRVSLERDGTWVTVSVEDEGPGIKEEVLERIFDRFYTDRPEGESFGNNSGLGLSISRQIIKAHRGHIKAENHYRADGGIAGARFLVRLPVGG